MFVFASAAAAPISNAARCREDITADRVADGVGVIIAVFDVAI